MDVKVADIVFNFSNLKTSKKRPVLVLKDNLPFDDFIAIPISSQINKLHKDEYLLDNTAFATGNIPKTSKLMLRKTFVVAKSVVIKKYGHLDKKYFDKYRRLFCQYFECDK